MCFNVLIFNCKTCVYGLLKQYILLSYVRSFYTMSIVFSASISFIRFVLEYIYLFLFFSLILLLCFLPSTKRYRLDDIGPFSELIPYGPSYFFAIFLHFALNDMYAAINWQ